MNDIYENIANHFDEMGYTWKFKDGDRVVRLPPTKDDIERVVDKAAGLLYGSVDGSTVDLAGLVVQKNGQEFTIYVRFGEVR